MGQQHNKIIKRRRRKNYVARKKALAKSGALRKSSRRSDASKSAAKKAVVKKPAVKKAKVAKKVDELAEVVAEVADAGRLEVVQHARDGAPFGEFGFGLRQCHARLEPCNHTGIRAKVAAAVD